MTLFTPATRLLVAALVVLLVLPMAAAAKDDKPQEIVDRASATWSNFMSDPDTAGFRNTVKGAKAVLIVPRLIKAGFIIGGSGGNGALLALNEKTGHWSPPAFYTMGAASFGAQIGAEASEVVLLVMTRKGLDSLLSTELKLGADVSVAAGPVGTGKAAHTADVLSYMRSKGAFAGVSVEGSVINPREKFNTAYYGKNLRPIEILIQGKAVNPRADGLRSAVKKAVR